MNDNDVTNANDPDIIIAALRQEIDQLHRETDVAIERLERLTATLRSKHMTLEAHLEHQTIHPGCRVRIRIDRWDGLGPKVGDVVHVLETESGPFGISLCVVCQLEDGAEQYHTRPQWVEKISKGE